MANITFVSPGFIGHISPALAIVRELVDRGESIGYLAPARSHPLIAASGAACESVPLAERIPQQPDHFDWSELPTWIAWECIKAMPEILRKLKKRTPDVLVVDATAYAARLAGEVLGLPMIRLSTNYALSDKVNYFTTMDDGRLRGTMASPEAMRRFAELMSEVFSGYGLRHRSFLELVLEPAELEIVFVSRMFHPHAEAYGPQVVFVGPSYSRAARPAVGGADFDRKDKRWLIYVSLGTLFNQQPAFYSNCLEAFADLEAHVVMSVGDAFAADQQVGVPGNIVIRPFVPQLDVLANADLFVTHGGMGSVMEALSFGVPMLLVPQYLEQMLSALRANDLGAGIFLDREEASISTLRAAATRILTEPSFQQRAQELGDAGRQDGGFRRAADCIQNFVAQHGKRPGAQVAVRQVLQDLGALSDDQVDTLLDGLLDAEG